MTVPSTMHCSTWTSLLDRLSLALLLSYCVFTAVLVVVVMVAIVTVVVVMVSIVMDAIMMVAIVMDTIVMVFDASIEFGVN